MGVVADNYLSLKAYAVTAEEKVVAYVGQGKGKNLSSLGDLLVNIAALSDVEVEKEEGLSPSGELPMIFSSGTVKVDNSVSKINGLVHEYITTVNSCRMRWPMGLGKYLGEARVLHGQEGCPPGRQDRGQGWQLGVRERPRCGSFQQAQRLRGPGYPHGRLRGNSG